MTLDFTILQQQIAELRERVVPAPGSRQDQITNLFDAVDDEIVTLETLANEAGCGHLCDTKTHGQHSTEPEIAPENACRVYHSAAPEE